MQTEAGRMMSLVAAAIVTAIGLWLVLVEGNLGGLAVVSAFGGGVWLLYAIIRAATAPRAGQ